MTTRCRSVCAVTGGLIVFVTTLLFVSGSAVHAQTGADALRFTERFPGVDIRMMGMGGAGIAGVGDAGAVFTNPAGLAYLDQTLLTGGLSTLVAQNNATYSLGQFESATDGRGSKTAPASLNYYYKVPTSQGSLVVGGGYNQTQGFTRMLSYEGSNDRSSITDFFMPYQDEFDIEQENGPDGMPGTDDDVFDITFFRDLSRLAFETYAIDFDRSLYESGDPVPFYPAVVRGTVTQSDEVVEEGRTGEVALGGAVEAFKNGILGFSLNVITGSYGYDRVYEEVDVNNANDGSGLTTDFQSLEYVTTLETDLIGLNLRGGMSTRISDNFRLGLMMETPSYYSASELYTTKIRTYFDNGDSYEFGGESNDPGTGEFDYNITTPWQFGIGGSVHVRGFRFAGDVKYVDWAQMRLSAGSDQDYFNDVNRNIRQDYAAVWPYRVGVEYVIGSVELRGGYAVQPDPGVEETNVDRDRTYYTGGIGYRVSRDFSLEASWMHERFEDQFRPYTQVSAAPTVMENVSRDIVTVGVKVRL
jgi:long-subunit fatty acid transport protein